MQKLFILFFCCFLIGGISAQSLKHESFSDILEQFDGVYKHRQALFHKRLESIDSLKRNLSELSPAQRMSQCDVIGEAYRKVRVDSSAVWFCRAEKLATQLGDDVKSQYFALKKIAVWPEMGSVASSGIAFDSIIANGIYPVNRLTYYEEGARMLAYTAWCTSFKNLHDIYQARSNELTDSLLAVSTDVDGVSYHMSKALHAYHARDEKTLTQEVGYIVSAISPSDYIYSEAFALLGIFYKDNGDYRKAACYLIKGACADMQNGRLESPSTEELIDVFERTGDLHRASLCAISALQNANESGANRRLLQVLEPIPNVLLAASEKNNRMVMVLFCLVVVLLLGLILIAVLTIKNRSKIRHLHKVKDQLARANYMKEAYMNRFMNLCSMYMQKTGDFMRLANRKINAGQQDELFSYIRSGKLLDEQTQLFYDNFDDVFVKVFPTFVHDVNELLLPDKRIVLPENVVLNTELRILAFTRLGITDGASIARFLDLSLNTIYTYRNKLRNRAINRDTFEKSVMNIGRIR